MISDYESGVMSGFLITMGIMLIALSIGFAVSEKLPHDTRLDIQSLQTV